MEKKLPDSYVVDRRLKTYPTEVGSVNFKVEDIDLFKNDKASNLKHYYDQKFNELKSQYIELMEDIQINQRLYECRYSFQPLSGHTYYLYKTKEDEFLSIIKPHEWGKKIETMEFIGAFLYTSDGRWVNGDTM